MINMVSKRDIDFINNFLNNNEQSNLKNLEPKTGEPKGNPYG